MSKIVFFFVTLFKIKLMGFILPVGYQANHQLAAWLHGHCQLVWSDPTGPNQDTDLQEVRRLDGFTHAVS